MFVRLENVQSTGIDTESSSADKGDNEKDRKTFDNTIGIQLFNSGITKPFQQLNWSKKQTNFVLEVAPLNETASWKGQHAIASN